MKIDEMKNSFVSLLRTNLDTNGKEGIRLSEKILEENGLSGSTFWNMVCPSLEKEGLLRYYNNPEGKDTDMLGSSDFGDFVSTIPEYQSEMKWLMEHGDSTPDYETLKKTHLANMSEITTKLRGRFIHKFVVDKEKLLKFQRPSGASMKIAIYVDQHKGIYRLMNEQAVRYPHVTCKSKIFLTISYLMQNEHATLKDLSDHNCQLQKSVKRSIVDFNEKTKSRLQLSVDPIIGDGIYELNRKYIDFI